MRRTMAPIGLAVAAALGAGGTMAQAATVSDLYSSFFVLGDSLSDNGNLFAATGGTAPASPPYFAGRFSNGPVWNEALLADFAAAGKPGANFAFGGARAVSNDEPAGGDADPATDTIPDLARQSATLLATAGDALAAGENDLVALWFGGNDGFAAVGRPDQDQRMREAADAVIAAAGSLGEAGAETVLVFTLPDLGGTPLYSLFQPGERAASSQTTDAYNDALLAGLPGVTGTMVEIFDAEALFADLLESEEGLETSLPCLFPDAGVAAAFGQPLLCGTPSDYAFFDSVHPTDTVHAFIDGAVREALAPAMPAPVPLPAGAPLLALGLAALGIGARRRAGG